MDWIDLHYSTEINLKKKKKKKICLKMAAKTVLVTLRNNANLYANYLKTARRFQVISIILGYLR